MLSDTAMRQTVAQGGGFTADAKSLPIGSGALQRLRQASAFEYEIRQMAEDLAGRLLGLGREPEHPVPTKPEPGLPPVVSELHQVAERIEQQQARTLAALRPLLEAFG